MSLLQFGEVFGYDVNDSTKEAYDSRSGKFCPFRNSKCNKVNLADPIGICSLSAGDSVVTICPTRFQEDNRIFRDAAIQAFGADCAFSVNPEIRILNVVSENGKLKKIGKVDFVLAKLNEARVPIDFCALEVQSVYFSGASVKASFKNFLREGILDERSKRRPDFRSSAQKRLMPQLAIKVPVFRRWGKKFFVAVDSNFFSSIPQFKRVETLENSEITWLVYTFAKQAPFGYKMAEPEIVFSHWDDVSEALREGTAPSTSEILRELSKKVGKSIILKI